MDLQYFKQYFENNGTPLEIGIRLYYHHSSMFGDDEIILHFRGNKLTFDIDYGGDGKISIVTPCTPSEIKNMQNYIDIIDNVEWNELGKPIKEELLNYLRKLHGIDGAMTKACK